MGIKLTPANTLSRVNSPSEVKVGNTAKFTSFSLPFLKTQAPQFLAIWRSRFLPRLYEWAGMLANPWATNSDPAFASELMCIWCEVFPSLVGHKDDPAIEYVAAAALRTWRSDLGKAGLAMVNAYFAGKSSEEILDEITGLTLNPRFIQRDPDAPVGQRGAWLSELFLQVFIVHLADTMKVDSTAYPTGALSLCAASVERALDLWKTGVKTNKENFSDGLWGSATETYALSAAIITAEKWATIFDEASTLIARSKPVKRDAGRPLMDYALDPRAAICD
ncbi:hypothetical protein BC835DRAFT_1424024 [Cytidiella melzeri]|nr:hypothetical protein BC835DRAFT_1424024 [Cytidiella melzeri]